MLCLSLDKRVYYVNFQMMDNLSVVSFLDYEQCNDFCRLLMQVSITLIATGFKRQEENEGRPQQVSVTPMYNCNPKASFIMPTL